MSQKSWIVTRAVKNIPATITSLTIPWCASLYPMKFLSKHTSWELIRCLFAYQSLETTELFWNRRKNVNCKLNLQAEYVLINKLTYYWNTLPTASFHRVFKTNLTRVSDTKNWKISSNFLSRLYFSACKENEENDTPRWRHSKVTPRLVDSQGEQKIAKKKWVV